MASIPQNPDKSPATATSADLPDVPTLSLPKGGGAIRGIGEKFAANPGTGTGSLTVPIATSPGRSGFGPQLSLTYDSGAGNGSFGMGWSLSLPAITRKTDKGLPRYRDREESDVFLVSGAEDLVPALRRDGAGRWILDEFERDGYRIKRYRPRTEGSFARIERWTRFDDGEVHWRSISKNNVLTVYGSDVASRIADPADPAHVFSWLIRRSCDDKGNAIVYEYASENADGVDLARVNERNRIRTANRYLKRIRYGNRRPLSLDATAAGVREPHTVPQDSGPADWMFEAVFDYGDGHYRQEPPDGDGRIVARASATQPPNSRWPARKDPFSTYRPGFEVRTYRLCRRVLMFHRFPDELGVDHTLVRSTEFEYHEKPIGSFITRVVQSGYTRQPDGRYLRGSLPALDLSYTSSPLEDPTRADYPVKEVDPLSLENLPGGIDGGSYRWLDLDGEGISGVLSEQGNAWFYKPNLGNGHLGPVRAVATRPSLAALSRGRQQLLDVEGDGNLDLVDFSPPTPGFYERTASAGWRSFRAFPSLPTRDWNDPNLKFVDVTGDGIADVLVTEDEALTWHPSLGKEGFGAAARVWVPLAEEKGPRVVFADGTQSIYLADMSGDGLPDIVRIRDGEVCYWPNHGYGKFGAKVTMDHSPWFDHADLFDQRRIRLADTDGSGTTDLIYLGRDGARIFLNEVGNGWSSARVLEQLPITNDLTAISVVDFLGRGTACLLWSSPLPYDSRRPLRYIDLMCGRKPHLLTRVQNNLGAESVVEYASSTEFYLADRAAGTPWITRLPFPVHVVRRVETYDRIGRNRFVTRYAYHHGYFDAIEREFHGFGMVEQWDTEEFAALSAGDHFPVGDNIAVSSCVPPVLTRTWFHTGALVGGRRVSRHFEEEYYDETDEEGMAELTEEQAYAMVLDDTVLPEGLSSDEAREARRALKGSVLRQEVYAADLTDEAGRPYRVSERSYTLKMLQPREENRHAVFFSPPRETIDFYYERKLYTVGGRRVPDPRVSHTLILEVDDYGNALQSAAVSYGRRRDDPDPRLTPDGRAEQKRTRITYSENHYTNPVLEEHAYRTPLPCESRTYELLKVAPSSSHAGVTNLFRFEELRRRIRQAADGRHDLPYEDVHAEGAVEGHPHRRPIEHTRTLYRSDDLAGPLPLGRLQSRALPFAGYALAFTPGLVAQVYGGRVTDAMLETEGRYVHSEGDDNWWIPSGEVFYSPDEGDAPAGELAHALRHFFLPHRFRDPFGTTTAVTYDAHNLLVLETRDALGNRITAGERDPTGDIVSVDIDYRVLQPRLVTDANRNRAAVAFNTLGMVVGTAVMGKPEEQSGDSLAGFQSDLASSAIAAHMQDPSAGAHDLLRHATTRLVYDFFAYQRTRDEAQPQAPVVHALAREIHASDQAPGQETRIRHSFSYSDGFGHEVQQKLQAEPGPLHDGGPTVASRWVGSGWTVLNNKGKPVRKYEPFFSTTHQFEFARSVGVSPILIYDPAERVIATFQPDHSWVKTAFDPWCQQTWDASDTVLLDPRTDADAGGFARRLPDADYLPTWYAQRVDGGLGPREQEAARKAAVHASTPTVAYFDSLGRTFLTVAHNRFLQGGAPVEESIATRVVLDIENNQREVVDARGRRVMRYDYDLLGHRVHEASMESGERRTLHDVAGKMLYTWDSRGHRLRTAYDSLRRPTDTYLGEGAGPEVRVGRTIYGEARPSPETGNLRGKVVELFDQVGVVTSDEYDFKGNLLRSRRQLAREYKTTLDWSAAVLLEEETYTSRTRYDALNRATELTAPDDSVIRPTYNEANLLERLDATLRGAAVAISVVTNVDYDAKGRRTRIEYGNGVGTCYEYDPLTFRLIHLRTRRNAAVFPDDCPQPPPAGWPGRQAQDLHYTYDPVGNITHIRDDAQQTIYFRNRRVDPSAEYTYDAIYRLIEATGREHLGQTGGHPNPPTTPVAFEGFHTRLGHPGDGNAMGLYVERYLYDAVGNLLAVQHRGRDPAHPGWARAYVYGEPSQLEAGKANNRLSSTSLGAATETYRYDGPAGLHGNVTSMPHLPLMQWDYRDQLQATAQQVLNDGSTPETTWYAYDGGGERVRKVTERQAAAQQTPTRVKERIYIGGFEIYREYGNDGDTVKLERETLHVLHDKRCIALVETRTLGDDGSLAQLIRYQLGDNLGSASLELDDSGQIISYEEYYPYGSTSYQAVRSRTETPKRYRYIGRERDEESGFSYQGARYYAPWLGRWTSADPAGLIDGPNRYDYARNNPVCFADPNGLDPDPAPVSPGGRVVALGRTTIDIPGYGQLPFFEEVQNNAAQATGLRPTIFGGLLATNPQVRADWNAVQGAGLPPGYRGLPSGVLLQQVLEGATPVYITTTGVDVLSDTHTSAELRQLITHLSTGSNEHADIYFQEGADVSRIPRGTSVVVGAPLPERIARSLPPSFSSSTPPPSPPDVPPAPPPTGGNTVPTAPGNGTVPTSSGGSTLPPAVAGTSTLTTAGNFAANATRTLVPGVAETELALTTGSVYASAAGYSATGAALSTAAAYTPVVGGSLVTGAVVGNLAEAGATELGANRDVAQGAGALAAAGTGAAVGALIGSAFGGVGAGPGAAIGALAGLGGYYLSKL
jgi:RHS repeat-associated protein